jgi:hypothetical protein
MRWRWKRIRQTVKEWRIVKAANQKPIAKLLLYGGFSLSLYALIYFYEQEIMHWTTRGGWYFIIPIMLAFLFAFFHGALTQYFWEAVGVRARNREGKQQ